MIPFVLRIGPKLVPANPAAGPAAPHEKPNMRFLSMTVGEGKSREYYCFLFSPGRESEVLETMMRFAVDRELNFTMELARLIAEQFEMEGAI